jgi:chemotaxis protein methyltransferase CheR
MSVAVGTFNLFAELLRSRTGIVLAREKSYLLESRLLPVAKHAGLAGIDELAAALVQRSGEGLATDVVEAMLNNETFFFRDNVPFDLLKNVMLPALRQARGATRTIRIWCAAASTGQEPYSIAMMLAADDAAWAGWNVEIVATDVSRRALARAEAGLYTQFEVQRGLPIQLLIKHFEQEGEQWRIAQDIRRRVRFRQVNLCQPFAHLGNFDIVLCRNVLMYLDQASKSDILSRMRRLMPDDGYLLLGAAETVLGLSVDFRPDWVNRGLYLIGEVEPRMAAAG